MFQLIRSLISIFQLDRNEAVRCGVVIPASIYGLHDFKITYGLIGEMDCEY